jgi:hypothetical protein
MTESIRQLQGSCHCGAVRFDFELPARAPDLRRCNCSLCRHKGAIMLSVAVGQFRIRCRAETFSLYQWNHQIARHYFCRVCGILTHHKRRSIPLQIGVNVGCLEEVDPAKFDTVVMKDGASSSTA